MYIFQVINNNDNQLFPNTYYLTITINIHSNLL